MAGAKVFNVFKEGEAWAQRRISRKHAYFPPIRYRVDGKLFERWLLKTLINLCYGGAQPIGLNGEIAGAPDEKLIRICYGLDTFSGKAGMYVTACEHQTMTFGGSFHFSPMIDLDADRIVGGCFHFRGLFLYLALTEFLLPTTFFQDIKVGYYGPLSEWKLTQPTWHFSTFQIKINDRLCHTIFFDW